MDLLNRGTFIIQFQSSGIFFICGVLLPRQNFVMSNDHPANEAFSLAMESTASPATKREIVGVAAAANESKAPESEGAPRAAEDYDGLLDLHVHFNSAAHTLSQEAVSRNVPLSGHQQCRPTVHHLAVDGEVYERWRHFGNTHGMTSDTEIASFLMQQYDNTIHTIPTGNRCAGCHTLMSLYCTKCSGIVAQETNPAGGYSLPNTVGPASIPLGPFVTGDCSAAFQLPPLLDSQTSLPQHDGKTLAYLSENRLKVPKKKKKLKKIRGKKGEYTCRECGTHIVQTRAKKGTRRTGYKPYKCNDCGAAYTYRRGMEEHLFKKDELSNSYQCVHCETVILNPNDLKAHTVRHTGEMPFKCSQCPLAFSLSCNLKTHMRTHTGERPFICTVCARAFTQSIALKVHMRKHTGEKPFRCDKCDMAFAASSNLSRHMLKHTGEKPYKCQFCEAAFSQPGSLKTHTRKHTGEKPYRCETCGAAFSDHSTLWKHKRNNSCAAGSNQARSRKLAAAPTPSPLPPPPPPPPLPQPSTPAMQMTVPMGGISQQQVYRPPQIEEAPYVGSVTWCFPMQHHSS